MVICKAVYENKAACKAIFGKQSFEANQFNNEVSWNKADYKAVFEDMSVYKAVSLSLAAYKADSGSTAVSENMAVYKIVFGNMTIYRTRQSSLTK